MIPSTHIFFHIAVAARIAVIYGAVLLDTNFGPRTYAGGDFDCNQFHVGYDIDTASITMTGSLDYSQSTGGSFSTDFQVRLIIILREMEYCLQVCVCVFVTPGRSLGWRGQSRAIRRLRSQCYCGRSYSYINSRKRLRRSHICRLNIAIRNIPAECGGACLSRSQHQGHVVSAFEIKSIIIF